MVQSYSYTKYDANRMARARVVGAEISTKHSIEIASAIRGKPLDKAIEIVKRVSEKKAPLRFTRYIQESASHKPGIGPGKYPVKASLAYIKLLEGVKKNAIAKDMDEEKLRILHVKADKGPSPYHYGRHRGRTMKRTHIEIIVIEDEKITKKKEQKREQKKKTAPKKSTTKKTDKPKEAAKTKSQAKKPEDKKDTVSPKEPAEENKK
ncbi:MAG: 50S ribosomal protein L22 [Candidatus Woesearchaeota archaeon]